MRSAAPYSPLWARPGVKRRRTNPVRIADVPQEQSAGRGGIRGGAQVPRAIDRSPGYDVPRELAGVELTEHGLLVDQREAESLPRRRDRSP